MEERKKVTKEGSNEERNNQTKKEWEETERTIKISEIQNHHTHTLLQNKNK